MRKRSTGSAKPSIQHSASVNRQTDSETPLQSVEYPVIDHPQLCVITTPLYDSLNHDTGLNDARIQGFSYHREYRVYNWRKLPSGRILSGGSHSFWWFFLCVLGWVWRDVLSNTYRAGKLVHVEIHRQDILITVAALILWLWLSSRGVLYQSVIPLPGLGIQLSTTCGFSIARPWSSISISKGPFSLILVPINTSHTFIPLNEISTVVINEGLSRWNVHFYLAVIKKRGEGVVVAYDALRQPIDVLRDVYHGTREALFDEYDISVSK